MEIDFPSSRRTCTGRSSSSSHDDNGDDDDVEESILSGVTSTSSRYEGGGSLLWPSSTDDDDTGRGKTKKKKKRSRRKQKNQMKSSSQRHPTTTSSSYASSNYVEGAGQIAADFPTDRTPFHRRPSHENSYSGESKGSIKSHDLICKEGVREEQSSSSRQQSLREKELRQSLLRASIVRRRNKSMDNLERRPSIERRPSKDDLLEQESRQSSLVAAHKAQQGGQGNNGLSSSSKNNNNNNNSAAERGGGDGGGDGEVGGLQRSFHSASCFDEGSMRSSFEQHQHSEHHASIPTSLVSSLNNNSADNPNPGGEFLCEEFVSRSSFQKTKNNLHVVDEKSGSGMLSSPVEPLIMEEEYDPRKPWRKAPAVAVNCKNNNNRRGSTATFRSSLNSSLNFDPDVMKDFQEQIKDVKAYQDQQKEQHQDNNNHDDNDQENLMQSSRSSRSLQSASEALAVLTAAAAAAAAPVVDEVPPDPPLEDTSLSTAQRETKADESTALSSLAQDDDDSELTELRHAQEALFPIQEGGFKKKITEGSEQSDAVSGISFGVEALENSELLLPLDSGDRKQAAHRNDVSLDIVQEEDAHIVQEKILLQKQQQKQQQIEDIIREQEQLQNQQDQEDRRLEPEQKKRSGQAITMRRLSSDDFGANQIREDLQLDDLPSSAGDIYNKRRSHNDSDTFSDVDIEANPRSSTTKVCLNFTDDSIENEFSTTKLEDIEFGGRESKLYQEEEENLDVSELGLLFEANRNDDDILQDQDDNSTSSRGTGTRTSSSKVSSKKTNSTLESAIQPLKNILKRSASSIDTKTTTNIRRRNKRLWKFCVWNCRKITACVILLLGVFVAIGVLAWLGAVKNSQAKNTGGKGTGDGDTDPATNIDGSGLDGVEQPSAEGPGFNLQPLENGPTQPPSLSPSQSYSPSTRSIILNDGDGPGNIGLAPSIANTSRNETQATESPSTAPSVSTPPVAATIVSYPTNPPISVNVPSVQTDISGAMAFSEPVPKDTEANLIMFLDALKKTIRSTVSPSLDTNDELIYVEINSIDGEVVGSLLQRRRFLRRWLQTGSSVGIMFLDALKKTIRSTVSPSLDTNDELIYVEINSIDGEVVGSLLQRRRFLRRWLQTGSSVDYNIVVLTNCDFSGCTDADTVADDVFSRVNNEMTTSVTSGAFSSTLEVNMISSSGGSLEYVTGVELGDFSEPTVTVLSPSGDYGANETSNTDSTTSTTDIAPSTYVNTTANETNPTLFVNETATANASSIADSSTEDGTQPLTPNDTIDNSNVTSNPMLKPGFPFNATFGGNQTLSPYPSNGNSTPDGWVVNDSLSSFTNSTVDKVESSVVGGNSTTISFNTSAFNASFSPSPTLASNETFPVSYANETLLNKTEELLTSNPAYDMENSAMDNSTT